MINYMIYFRSFTHTDTNSFYVSVHARSWDYIFWSRFFPVSSCWKLGKKTFIASTT